MPTTNDFTVNFRRDVPLGLPERFSGEQRLRDSMSQSTFLVELKICNAMGWSCHSLLRPKCAGVEAG